ncbi:MAG: hypothetical protein PHH93_12880 [Prolixibacteraceae bacterium]|nr:hypothetical protein [Prolixibacteraceae bacterium]
MENQFIPVDPDFYDKIKELKKKNILIQVHFFGFENELKRVKGVIKGIIINNKREEFLEFDSGDNVRLDRIITLDGKPGPAFDEYDGYALACLECTGGMD